jgi:hypothetical protein
MSSIDEIKNLRFDDKYEIQKYIASGGLNYSNDDFDFQLIIKRKNDVPRDPDIFGGEFERFLEKMAIEVDVESDATLRNMQERIEKINVSIYPQKIIIEDRRKIKTGWDAVLYIESGDNYDRHCVLRCDFVKKPDKSNYHLNIYNSADNVPFSISAFENYFLSEKFLKDLNDVRDVEKKRKERVIIFRNSFVEKSNRHIIYMTPGYILGTIGTLLALFWSITLVVFITVFMLIANVIVKNLNKRYKV